MADLDWRDLQPIAPGTGLEIGNGAMRSRINIDEFFGEPIDPNFDSVGRFLHEFLKLCRQGQADYNSANSSDLNSYPEPTYSAPVKGSDGHWYSIVTHTLRFRVRVDPDQVNAVIV